MHPLAPQPLKHLHVASLGGSSTRESIHGHPLVLAHSASSTEATTSHTSRRLRAAGSSTRVAAALHCLDTLLQTDSHGVPLRASAMVCNSFSDKSAKQGAIDGVCIFNGTHSLAIYGARKAFVVQQPLENL